MKVFDPLQAPMSDATLIEASAGTGKTYTIVLLVYKMLMQQLRTGSKSGIESILIVTFTEAASKELRSRVRDMLTEAKRHFQGKTTDDPTKLAVFESDADLPLNDRMAIIDKALREVHTATITTIHSFCNKALQEYIFESGFSFELNLENHFQSVLIEWLKDYRRNVLFEAPKNDIEAIEHELFASIWKQTPDFLHKYEPLFASWDIHFDEPEVSIYDESISEELLHFQSLVGQVKEFLADDDLVAEFSAFIKNGEGHLNGNVFRKGNQYVEKLKSLIDSSIYQADEKDLLSLEKLSAFALQSKLKKPKKKSSPEPNLEDLLSDTAMKLPSLLDVFFRSYSEIVPRVKHLYEVSLLRTLAQYVREKKEESATMGFDDLLRLLNDALEERPELAQLLRNHYPYALIDEYQDTDPIQFSIFQHIYLSHRAQTCIYFIGDPKQSIYSFRNADIATYLAAKSLVAHQFTIGTNYRSSAAYIEGVNRLFAYDPSIDRFPFHHPDIKYEDSSCGNNSRTLMKGEKHAIPFVRCLATDAVRLSKKEDVRAHFTHLLVHKLGEVLSDETLRIETEGGKRRIVPGDIAILVRTNEEATLIKHALIEVGIQSVGSSRDSIFNSVEYEWVMILLQAMLHARSPQYVKSAYALSIFHRSLKEIEDLNEHPTQEYLSFQESLKVGYDLWKSQGVYVALRTTLSSLHVYSYLNQSVHANRHFTNISHLLELFDHIEQEKKYPPLALLSAIQRYADDRTTTKSEEEELYLESDEAAVSIYTYHKSKGLEFPLIFCPFLSLPLSPPKSIFPTVAVQHRTDAPPHYIGLLNDQPWENDRQFSAFNQIEAQRELLRVAYVVLTRAQHQCYFFDVEYESTRQKPHQGFSPITWLFTKERGETYNTLPNRSFQFDTLMKTYPHLFIEERVDTSEPIYYQSESKAIEAQPPSQFYSDKLGLTYGFHSFSSITKHSKTAAYESERDAEIFQEITPLVSKEVVDTASVFHVPQGAHVGSLLHNVLEVWDFKDETLLHEHIQKEAEIYLPDPKWFPALTTLCTQTVTTPLTSTFDTFRLCDLEPSMIKKELEFHWKQSSFETDALFRLLGKEESHALSTSLLPGFLKGFIDLIFWHQNRWYIVDYKSNYLGDSIDDYSQEKVTESMKTNYYDVQYYLYAAFMDAYFKKRLKNYQFETHAGGVFYLYMRGLGDKSKGVFYDPLNRERLEGIQHLLTGGKQ